VQDHVPIERLLKVAASDDVLFTVEEVQHLERCSDCFKCWAVFIAGLASDEPTQKAKAKKQKNGG
jgi:hypothetical protein